MNTYTRRHWLKLAASLLSLIGALRRVFGPPPEVVECSRRVFNNVLATETRRRLRNGIPFKDMEMFCERRNGTHRLMIDVVCDGRTIRYAGPWEADHQRIENRTLS